MLERKPFLKRLERKPFEKRFYRKLFRKKFDQKTAGRHGQTAQHKPF